MIEAVPSAVNCPLCGGDRAPTFYIERGIRFVRCACGCIHQVPRPALQAWIPRLREHAPHEASTREAARRYRRVYRRAADRIGHLRLPGRLVELGCGYGDFLSLMTERGWHVSGMDASAVAVAECRRRGLDVLHASIEEFTIPLCDVVVGLFIFEHLLDPLRVLTRIRASLRPEGCLYLRTPDTAPIVRLGRHVMPRWNFFHTPWHWQIVPPRRLCALLRNLGFSPRVYRPPLPGITYDVLAHFPSNAPQIE